MTHSFMKTSCRVMIFIITVCNRGFSLAGHRVTIPFTEAGYRQKAQSAVYLYEIIVVSGFLQVQLFLLLGRHSREHAVEDVVVPLALCLKTL